MAYTPTSWANGNTVTAALLNNIETALVNLDAPAPIPVAYSVSHSVSQRQVAIQNALDSATAGDTVQLAHGKTWTITNSGSTITAAVASGTTSLNYCLKIPSGVCLDLNGGTIQRDAGAGDCVLAINAHPTVGGGDTNTSIINGVFDGNNVDNPLAATLWLFGITGDQRPLLDKIEVKNAKRYGIYVAGCTDVRIGYLVGRSNAATPFTFGLNATNHKMTRSFLGNLLVRDTSVYSGNPTNFPGNPIVAVALDCTFGTWDVYNSAAGIKVYETDGLQGQQVFVGASTGTDTNSGLKLQGDVTNHVKNVQIAEVRAEAQNGSGLYMEYTEDCAIGAYDGIGNCLQASQSDLWMGGTRDRLNTARITGSTGQGVIYRNYGSESTIQRLIIQNPTGFGVQCTMAAGIRHRIGDLYVTDDRGGGALMTRGVQVDGTGGNIEIGRRHITGATAFAVNVSTGGTYISSPGGEPPYIRNAWIFAHRGTNTTGATTHQQLRVTPTRIKQRLRIVGMAVEITVVGEAGSTFVPVIYADQGTGVVGPKIVEGSALNTNAATGWVQTSAFDVTLDPGLYYIGGLQLGATTTPPTLRILASGSDAGLDMPATVNTTLPGTNPGNMSFTRSSLSSCPTDFGSTAVSGTGAARVILLTSSLF